MSEIGISYSATTQPPEVGVRFRFGFLGTTLKASLLGIDDFIILLNPSGNVGEQILSGIAWPLAQLMGAVLPTKAKSLFNGFSFDVVFITPTNVYIGDSGLRLTVDARDLGLTSSGGYLVIQGTVRVS